jgi:hypothetical protein
MQQGPRARRMIIGRGSRSFCCARSLTALALVVTATGCGAGGVDEADLALARSTSCVEFSRVDQAAIVRASLHDWLGEAPPDYLVEEMIHNVRFASPPCSSVHTYVQETMGLCTLMGEC